MFVIFQLALDRLEKRRTVIRLDTGQSRQTGRLAAKIMRDGFDQGAELGARGFGLRLRAGADFGPGLNSWRRARRAPADRLPPDGFRPRSADRQPVCAPHRPHRSATISARLCSRNVSGASRSVSSSSCNWSTRA